MEIKGTIYRILPQQEVTFSDGGKMMKGGFVIMREGESPKPVAFELFGEERLTLLNGLAVGMPVQVSFYADSREGKDGKFYTTLKCTHLTALGGNTIPTATSPTPLPTSPVGQMPVMNDDDEVPF